MEKEDFTYRVFRSIYKKSFNGEIVSIDNLINSLKKEKNRSVRDISNKELKSIINLYTPYLDINKDYSDIRINGKAVKFMKSKTIEKLKNREINISPTSLKVFSKYGPSGFLNYFVKPSFRQTPDMILGIALETYILEHEKFDKMFAILDVSKRPVPESTFAKKENKEWKDTFEQDNKGKYIISIEDLNKIKEIDLQVKVTNNLWKDINEGEVQVELVGEYEGLPILGKLDLYTPDKIYDFKKCQDAIFDRVKWTVMNDYLIQGVTYWWLDDCIPKISFLFMDMDAHVIEVGISEQKLAVELDKVKSYLDNLKLAIDKDKWDLGVEFIQGGKFIIF